MGSKDALKALVPCFFLYFILNNGSSDNSTCELKIGRFTHSEVFFSNEIDEKNETNERITL